MLYLDDPQVMLIDLGLPTSAAALNGPATAPVVRIHVSHQPSSKARDKFAAEASLRIGFAVEIVVAAYHLHLHCDAPETITQSMLRDESIGTPILHNRRLKKMGGIVRERQSGEEMLLGSWHVLANSHLSGERLANVQSTNSTDTGQTFRSAMHAGLDAAAIRLGDINPNEEIAIANGVATPQLGMRVKKSAGGASETFGMIAGLLGYRMQQSDNGGKHLVGPLIHIAPEEPGERICDFGDSGAWWLEASTRRAVALHFAGSQAPSFALAFSMPEVLEALDVEIIAAPDILPWQRCEAYANAAAPAAAKKIPAAIPRLAPNWSKQQAYRFAAGGLLLAFGVIFGGLCYQLPLVHRQQQERIAQMQMRLQRLKIIVQADSARQQQIQRIVAIIERFNRNMKDELKFRLAAEIHEMSLKYNRLDAELICATITHETGRTWNPEAVSPAGALGLMQILPTTGIYLAKAEGLAWTSADAILFDPIYNLRLGCRYLNELIANYGLEAGLAAYNGGGRQAKLWLQGGSANQLVHAETAHYVPAVLRIYEEYRR